MRPANFAPIADDGSVFGACRPGHLGADVDEWAEILSSAGVSDVVCLLSESEAARWMLPRRYDDVFGTYHVPIRDRHLPEPDRLARAVGVIEETTTNGGRVALHCNAGQGRTGVVAAAWVASAHDCAPRTAVETVEAAGRSPREAIRADNATEQDLYDLLERVRQF